MIDIVNDPIGTPSTPDTQVKPHVVLLLDESGSMNPYRQTVVSTFNEYVAKVRGTARSISLYTFDSEGIREKIYKQEPSRIRTLTIEDYKPNQMTPLYDAMGHVMKKFEYENRPVQFVTHTDGVENDSREWTKVSLDEYIAKLSSKASNPWLFTYLMEGLEGRETLKTFQGLKFGMSEGTRSHAMGAVATSTAFYAATLDSNPNAYTTSGGDTDDLDELSKTDDGKTETQVTGGDS